MLIKAAIVVSLLLLVHCSPKICSVIISILIGRILWQWWHHIDTMAIITCHNEK
jgi:hypothetical protein